MLRRTAFSVMFALLALFWTPPVAAQGIDPLLAREFDARDYASSELRLLQWALSLSGDYNGLLDGKWGKRSQTALERYSFREFEDRPRNLHLPVLAVSLVNGLRDDGWQFSGHPGFGGSMLFPTKTAVQQRASGSFQNWQHTTSSLRYGFALTTGDALDGFHRFVADLGPLQEPIYWVRRADRVVTSAVLRSGERVYMRSDPVGRLWRTVVLRAEYQDRNLLAAVAASISGDAPLPLYLPENGQLQRVMNRLSAEIDRENAVDKPPAPAPAPQVSGRSGSGSGFLVTLDGLGLTNQHVVEGCGRLMVNGQPATVTAQSETFDLALIRLTAPAGLRPAIFADRPAALNADVVVAGFPFAGVLEGLNVTRGAVSSSKGLAGDDINIQISAPVQPGNSGGPLLNEYGQVAGVVVAKLREAAGSPAPENVNFAVAGEIAKLFLARNGVVPQIAGPTERLDGATLGQVATAITFLVECFP